MSQADPPPRFGPDPIAAAQRDDGSLSNGDLISAYESGPQGLRDAVAGLTPGSFEPGRWKVAGPRWRSSATWPIASSSSPTG